MGASNTTTTTEPRQSPMPQSKAPAGWYPDPGEPTRKRYWDGEQWTTRYEAEGQTSDEQEANPVALALAGLGAALAVIGVFLPRADSKTFITVANNTLIQSTDGWIIIALAVGILGAAYAAYSKRRRDLALAPPARRASSPI